MTQLLTQLASAPAIQAPDRPRPRLGFLGLGWIGRHRLETIAQSGAAEITAIADLEPEKIFQASLIAPEAYILTSFEQMLNLPLDGVVIATPSAMHAEQALMALDRGLPVFCQKPLGRTAGEVINVVEAARLADRLLAVDLSYRYIPGMKTLRNLIQSSELGRIFAVDLVFHNAGGPDKGWFYNPKLSGGGCVIDLGIHLMDLALWAMDYPSVTNVCSRLYAGGEALGKRTDCVEDYATAQIELDNGVLVRLSCSWHLPAGCDSVIEASFYGTQGGVMAHNINGSFYDFIVKRCTGTRRRILSMPPDTPHPYAWGGRAIVEWTQRLAPGQHFDPEAKHLVELASALDAIYGR